MSQVQKKFLVTTSWDDGHPLDERIAELLSKYGLPGTFYVPRSGQRDVLSPSAARALSKSFELGGHTLEHLPIDRLSDEETRAQLSSSREWVEQLTGKSCRVFCFPGGKFRSRQLRFVRQAGYKAARTVELLSTATPRRIDGLFLISTTVQVFPHSPYAYARNTLKRFSPAALRWPRGSFLSRDWAALARDLLSQAFHRGGVFHIWGHSWEIEEQGQWDKLEEFLKILSSQREKWKGVTNGELCECVSQVVPREPTPVAAACAERAE